MDRTTFLMPCKVARQHRVGHFTTSILGVRLYNSQASTRSLEYFCIAIIRDSSTGVQGDIAYLDWVALLVIQQGTWMHCWLKQDLHFY